MIGTANISVHLLPLKGLYHTKYQFVNDGRLSKNRLIGDYDALCEYLHLKEFST